MSDKRENWSHERRARLALAEATSENRISVMVRRSDLRELLDRLVELERPVVLVSTGERLAEVTGVAGLDLPPKP